MKNIFFYAKYLYQRTPFNSSRTYSAFADPTYDTTFKMIFGSEKNKHLLISLINNLLEFKDKALIQDLQIITSELPISYEGHIKTAIDVRCKTVDGREILVEVQRQYKDYFLSRSQYYMAKAINLQMQDGQSKLYKDKMLPIYLLTIARETLFRPIDHPEFKDDYSFEKTVVPTIREHKHIELPGNKMYWKYYELSKFKKVYENKVVTDQDPIKIQWLDFLSKSHERQETPKVDQLVKQAYSIVERAKWTKAQIEAFELLIANEKFEENYEDCLRIKAEEEKANEIAMKMLEGRMLKSDISTYTGLSLDQIDILEEKIKNTPEFGSKLKLKN